MFPQLEKKYLNKDPLPYHLFHQQIARHHDLDNNIHRLKLLKDFLEQ